MKVYVLNGLIDYEAGNTIGVFSSKEAAELIWQEYMTGFDSFEILEFEIDELCAKSSNES